MGKEIILTVKITASGEVDMTNQKVKSQLVGNVLDAIVDAADRGMGIVPEESEDFTEMVTVEYEGSALTYDIKTKSFV